MASLFTPESEKLAAAQKAKASANAPKANGLRIPGLPGIQSHKPGDSLGNGSTPGYEPWGKKKTEPEADKKAEGQEKAPGGTLVETSTQGAQFIRISVGWEKLLLTQKKLCEKAKGLFTLLDGPSKYASQRKSKVLSLKSRGCILDLDSHETHELAKEAENKAKEPKESA
jgi:hypothetical protein